MNFIQKYNQCEKWFDKVIVIELYHLAMSIREPGWKVANTAHDFGLSVGLVSENLRLAKEIHLNEKILKCESRQEALRKIHGHH